MLLSENVAELISLEVFDIRANSISKIDDIAELSSVSNTPKMCSTVASILKHDFILPNNKLLFIYRYSVK